MFSSFSWVSWALETANPIFISKSLHFLYLRTANSYSWDGRLHFCPEGGPIIWPSVNTDPSKWPSYDGRHLSIIPHCPLSLCLASSSFHYSFLKSARTILSQRTKRFLKGITLERYNSSSYMIFADFIHKGCPRKTAVLLLLSGGPFNI